MVSMTCLALVFYSLNNVLYGTQFSGNGFFTLDFLIGTAPPIATMSRRIGRLAYDSTNDRLVGTDDGPGDLYEIDRSTGAQTLILAATFFSYGPSNGFARTTHLTVQGNHSGPTHLSTAVTPPPFFPNPQPSPPSASAGSESAPRQTPSQGLGNRQGYRTLRLIGPGDAGQVIGLDRAVFPEAGELGVPDAVFGELE